MKKVLTTIAMFFIAITLTAAYNVGDSITEDIEFTDFNWSSGELVTTQQSVLNLISENKTVIFYFTQITYS